MATRSQSTLQRIERLEKQNAKIKHILFHKFAVQLDESVAIAQNGIQPTQQDQPKKRRPSRNFKCGKCRASCLTEDTLKKHREKFHRTLQYPDLNPHIESQNPQVSDHIEDHVDDDVAISLRAQTLQTDIVEIQPEDEPAKKRRKTNELQCGICGASFSSEEELESHKTTHDYSCAHERRENGICLDCADGYIAEISHSQISYPSFNLQAERYSTRVDLV